MQRGFTLVELLVVIAIVGILAGLLLPVFANSREKARQTTCLSNLQQIAMATLQYAQDWDETFPMSGYESVDALGRPCFVSAGSAISPFLSDRQILACPSNPNAYETSSYVEALGLTGGECGKGKVGGGSYALNEAVFVSGNAPRLGLHLQKPVRLAELRYASETVLAYDGNVALDNQCNFNRFAPAIDGRHLGSFNASFADGHAKALPTILSGCVARNINGKVLREYCLGFLSPYNRQCGQAVSLQCVNQLTGIIGIDERGICFMRLR